MYNDKKELYEFGNFRLDVSEHRLACTDGTLAPQLPEKAFQTLVLLVRNAGNLVNKQELLAAVWADAIVEENNLDKAIHLIRQTLGEKPGEQKYVETVRKHGYRFVAPVNELHTPYESALDHLGNGDFLNDRRGIKPVGEPIISTLTTKSGAFVVSAKWSPDVNEKIVHENGNHNGGMAVPVPVQISGPNRMGRVKWIALTFVLALSIGALSFVIYRSTDSTAVAASRSIAVFPLNPIDRANRNDLYEIGIADSLIHQLSAAKGIVARPLSSTRKYAEIEPDPIAAGREQKVDLVLASNYQVADGKFRLTAQLINVSSGKVEESYRVETDAGNVFAIQDAVALEVGNRLVARFGSDAKEFRSKRGTDNEEAYRHYQHAMTLFDQQRPGSKQKAMEYLDRAVEIDPNYAKGWAGKAVVLSVMTNTNRASDNDMQYRVSMEAAKKALAIDPNVSEAYAALCDNKFAYEYDFPAAEADCKRAIALDPNYSWARSTYAILLYSRGRFDEGFTEIKTAMEFEPASLRNQRIFSNGLYFARRNEEAIEVHKRLIDLNPDVRSTYLFYIRVLDESGREADALEILLKLLAFDKKDTETVERVKAAYASSGWPGVLRERIKIEVQEPSPNYGHIAEFYGALGDKDRAFEYLEKWSQKRGWNMMFLRVDPRFDPLRDDPRFEELISRIEG